MVAVREITWEEASSPDFGRETPQTAVRQAFRAAVAEVADKAKRTLPECNGRVDAAVKLVLAGDVELLDDGKARVASGYSAQATYLVADGTCECKDFEKAPSNWCKHRIATGLMKRAVGRADTLLDAASPAPGPVATTFPGTLDVVPAAGTPTPAPAPLPVATVRQLPPPLPEATASANCHVTIAGRQVQVTLRDTDETRLLARLTALLALYPVPEVSPGTPTPPTASAATGEGFCAIHQVQMRLNTKEGRSWYSHKQGDGSWCKGK